MMIYANLFIDNKDESEPKKEGDANENAKEQEEKRYTFKMSCEMRKWSWVFQKQVGHKPLCTFSHRRGLEF